MVSNRRHSYPVLRNSHIYYSEFLEGPHFHFQPRWSNRDQIYSLAWNSNNKKWTKYETTIFKTQEIRQERIDGQETKEMSCMDCPALLSWQGCQAQGQTREIQAESHGFPGAGGQGSLSSVDKVPEKRELHRARTPKICREAP